jgi:hypothetical protein
VNNPKISIFNSFVLACFIYLNFGTEINGNSRIGSTLWENCSTPRGLKESPYPLSHSLPQLPSRLKLARTLYSPSPKAPANFQSLPFHTLVPEMSPEVVMNRSGSLLPTEQPQIISTAFYPCLATPSNVFPTTFFYAFFHTWLTQIISFFFKVI